MRRILPPVLMLLALAAGDAPAARDPDAAAFARLVGEYREIAKDQRWPQVKRRRAIVREAAELQIPAVSDFLLKVFRDDREQAVRVPAMRALGARGTAKDLRTLVLVALHDRNDVYVILLPDALSRCPEPQAEPLGLWLAEHFLATRKPTVRAAVVRSLGHLGAPAVAEPIRKILAERDGDVRTLYEALIALARIDGRKSVPDLVPYLRHESAALREGAVTALGESGDPGVVEIVLPLARRDDPRTREAVAEVIRRQRAEAEIPVLIEMLKSGPLRVAAKANEVLEELTGEKLGLDPQAWGTWYERKQKKPPMRLPDAVGSTSTYYGMKVLSDRVLFLVDASGSMNAGRPPRIEIARKELARALAQLGEKTLFNVVGFGGSPMWWREKEQPATKAAIADATEFGEGLSVGGETNLYDTLVSALERNRLADTIFLLGDGCPSAGRVQEHDEILARIAWENRLRKVHINTVALVRRPPPLVTTPIPTPPKREEDEQEAADLLNRLATENGGTFVWRDG